MGDFSVSSIRALYRLRREDELQTRLRSKEERTQAGKASVRGLGSVERKETREEKEEDETPQEAAKVS